jgi:hypothetical protein
MYFVPAMSGLFVLVNHIIGVLALLRLLEKDYKKQNKTTLPAFLSKNNELE